MNTQIFIQLATVLESRKYKNIYIRKDVRNNWITDWNEYSFRYTPFGKNPNRHKAYVTVNGKLLSSYDLHKLLILNRTITNE